LQTRLVIADLDSLGGFMSDEFSWTLVVLRF